MTAEEELKEKNISRYRHTVESVLAALIEEYSMMILHYLKLTLVPS